MAQDEISKGSVKSGPPPPSAEGGGGPDFSLRRRWDVNGLIRMTVE